MLHDLTVIIFAMCEQEYFGRKWCTAPVSAYLFPWCPLCPKQKKQTDTASLLRVPSSFRTPTPLFFPLVYFVKGSLLFMHTVRLQFIE